MPTSKHIVLVALCLALAPSVGNAMELELIADQSVMILVHGDRNKVEVERTKIIDEPYFADPAAPVGDSRIEMLGPDDQVLFAVPIDLREANVEDDRTIVDGDDVLLLPEIAFVAKLPLLATFDDLKLVVVSGPEISPSLTQNIVALIQFGSKVDRPCRRRSESAAD